jgi:hypothetical protein
MATECSECLAAAMGDTEATADPSDTSIEARFSRHLQVHTAQLQTKLQQGAVVQAWLAQLGLTPSGHQEHKIKPERQLRDNGESS